MKNQVLDILNAFNTLDILEILDSFGRLDTLVILVTVDTLSCNVVTDTQIVQLVPCPRTKFQFGLKLNTKVPFNTTTTENF